jgi:hypothetical protein
MRGRCERAGALPRGRLLPSHVVSRGALPARQLLRRHWRRAGDGMRALPGGHDVGQRLDERRRVRALRRGHCRNAAGLARVCAVRRGHRALRRRDAVPRAVTDLDGRAHADADADADDITDSRRVVFA